MKGGHERRALPAERDVFAAEIGDDGNAGSRSDDVRIADLKRERGREAGSVTDRLPVATDGANGAGSDAGLREEFVHGLGEKLAKGDIGPPEAVDLVFAWNAEREQFASQGRGKYERMRSDERGLRFKSHERDINPVDTRAGKRADVELGGGRRVGSWRRTIHA